MNEHKFDMVKPEMARMNINIVGISEPKWTGMVNSIQMTIMSITACENPLEEKQQPSQSTKESEMQYLGETLKNDEMVSVHFQGKPFSMTVIQVYASNTDARKAKVD